MVRRYTYRRMDPGDLSAALDGLGLSVGQFSRLIGARYVGPDDSTVRKWLEGKQDIPAYMPVLIALLQRPGAVEIARKVIEKYLETNSEGG